VSNVILFVDDEPDVLALLRRTFPERDGWEALTAPGGAEALAILEQREVDLLVTDQRMPGMTGIELVTAAHRRWPDLCAILLTAYTDPRDLVDAINRGQVYRYLVKPWESADLRQTVLRAIEQVHLKRDRARLSAELERRLAALTAASEVARDPGAATSVERLLERLVEGLPGVVPCDVAAALVAAPGGGPVLLIRPAKALTEAALLAVKEDALQAWREHAGPAASEAAVRLRVLGTPSGEGPAAFRSRLGVPVVVDGATVGAIVLESAADEAFGEGDARVLDLLVNEVGAALRVLAERLQGERARLERVVEGLADGLVLVEAGGEAAVANPAAREMLRLAPGPVTAAEVERALGFRPLEFARAAAAAGEARPPPEVRREARVLAAVVSGVAGPDGVLAGASVALRDVTAQKRLEARKEEFVQVVSHELRTPLTAITGALDLVLGGFAGPLAEKQTRYLGMARDSADKLNALVDDLLDVARLAQGKMRMELERVPLAHLLRAAAERHQPAAGERGLEIQVEAPAAPVEALVDPSRIAQVLSNLLVNAVKFAPENGLVRLRLFVSPAVPGMAGVSCWNGGEGVPEADLERIFERFEQSRTERTRRVRGTGLGLSICRGLVEAHGGAVWAESAPGEGVRIVLALPAEPPPALAAAPPGDGERDAPAVLVLDEPDVAALAVGALAGRGLRARPAARPEDAVALARRFRPKVVVWDPARPDLAGLRLPAVLRNDPATRGALLLAFTAPAAREAAFREGADAVVAKPAGPLALADAAAAALERGRPPGVPVLIVDDDPAIRAICAEVLASHGYAPATAGSIAEARRHLAGQRPALVLLDVELPDGEGFELLEGPAPAARAADGCAVVFLSARTAPADKVRGLRLGADDYLAKPFDAQELVARVDGVVRRREAALHTSPMTRLPGGPAIDAEVTRRLAGGIPFALTYADLDNLKSYNDHYGYARADGVLLQLAGILREVAGEHGGEGAFLGHVGGDDFVVVTAPERAAAVGAAAIAAFDRVVPLYYDREDRERGYVEGPDRFGTPRRFPPLALSVATVLAAPGRFRDHGELARAAAGVKDRAKRVPGSVHVIEGEAR
jgi:signal transduction histidine kinase/DNA-binding response OmpR family regulator